MITKEQWAQLKAGDIMVSPGGDERKITYIHGGVLSFLSTRSRNGYDTTYVYNDIYKTYKIKNMGLNTDEIQQVLDAIGHKESKKYYVGYICTNCGHNGVIGVPKGKLVTQQPCQKCGCKTIQKK